MHETAREPVTRDSGPGLGVTLLGTNGGPPPVAARYGISSAVVVNGRTYVVDCGRGALSQYLKAGLSLSSLTAIFLTHLHADHTVDTFSFPLLAGKASAGRGFHEPIGIFGPGPCGVPSRSAAALGPVPGTVEMMRPQSQAFAASTTFFLAEHVGADPSAMMHVHDVLPPPGTGTAADPAPAMSPFTVMEDSDVRVTAILVPHGAAFPSYAYRFDTDAGSVVFSGDTALTPNIPRLAQGADLLVHEAVALRVLEGLGRPEALLTHLASVHTDVSDLGAVAAEAGVGRLVVSHLSPGQPAALSNAAWRRLIDRSRRRAGFGGEMLLGQDLMHLDITSGDR
jgi:ribonuclease BN (tRNA processing enzyme)